MTGKMLPRQGDLDSMLEHRQLRVLVVYDNSYFYLNQGRQDGLNVSLMREFERWLDRRYFRGHSLKMNVLFVPVRYDQLLPMLTAGKGDLVLANLTPTESRRKQVDFSIPNMTGLQEWLVSRRMAKPLTKLDELAGKQVWVRRSSSYYESLQTLNEVLAGLQLAPIKIELVDESLQDSDLLAMVSRGEIPMTLVDSHKAKLWGQAFPSLHFHRALPLRSQSSTAWAFRKNSPKLESEVNAFLSEYGQQTAKGQGLYRRYLQQGQLIARRYQLSTRNQMGWSKPTYPQYANLFQRYGDRYDLDWLMLMAQAYQESTLDQGARSSRGALGVMQVLPSTANEPYINVGNIRSLENNVHAGTKYMRYIMDTYFSDAQMDDHNRALFALAAYNAGPNRIAAYRKEAMRRGLNGNVWFGHVEKIAASRVGAETVNYVKNVSSRYVAYRRSYELIAQKNKLYRPG
ncbi:MAG: transglycosylase SLT domain-containing protein [Aeromonadaceae bacterium]